jgi:hypothetical protein
MEVAGGILAPPDELDDELLAELELEELEPPPLELLEDCNVPTML